MKKSRYAVIGIIMIMLLIALFSVLIFSKNKKNTKDKNISEPQVLTDIGEVVGEILSDEWGSIEAFHISDDEKSLYVHTRSMDSGEEVEMNSTDEVEISVDAEDLVEINKLWKMNISDGKCSAPVEINTDDYNIRKLLWDNEDLYFVESDLGYWIPTLYRAEIKDGAIVNAKELSLEKDISIQEVNAIWNKKIIFRGINGSKDSYYIGSIKDNMIVDISELSGIEENEYLQRSCLVNDEKEVLAELIKSYEETYDIGYELMKISENGFTDRKKIDVNKMLESNNIVNMYINSSKGYMYYISENKCIYKYSCKAFFDNIIEVSDEVSDVEEVAEEYNSGDRSYDAFDVVDFEMNKRNKSDESLKQGVWYEIFVRAFADSNGDGIGDFNGITEKLDYLKELGIDGLWLMPINETMSYHGYDITDYTALNNEYGTEEEFKNLLDEAHKRGLKVIMDFPINHTSSEHPWFKSAVSDENSEYRNYYRWVDKNDSIDFSKDDISNWGSRVWHKSGDSYYYGIFNADMPDLNYNNIAVREEIKSATKKWLELGVDGFRLDAAMHIYGDNEFKQIENQTDANIQWWNEFSLYCESINPNVYLVGEAWQNEDVLEEYVQPFDTKFNFSFQNALIESVKNNTAMQTSGNNISEYLQEVFDLYNTIDDNYLDGVFGSNHDQNRIMSQLESIEKAKLVANVYLTLPGNPFIYYGEEIGMFGKKPDEMIRTPFIWGENSSYNTTWTEDEQNNNTASLEEQINDENSMYNYYKNLITLRKENKALVNGDYEAVDLKNDNIMAYIRKCEEQKLLVIHNMSEEEQVIDLSGYDIKGVIYGLEEVSGIYDLKLKGNGSIIVELNII